MFFLRGFFAKFVFKFLFVGPFSEDFLKFCLGIFFKEFLHNYFYSFENLLDLLFKPWGQGRNSLLSLHKLQPHIQRIDWRFFNLICSRHGWAGGPPLPHLQPRPRAGHRRAHPLRLPTPRSLFFWHPLLRDFLQIL